MKDMLMKKSPLNNRERAAHCENNEQSLEPPPAKKTSWLARILGPTTKKTNGRMTLSQKVAKEFDQYLHYPKVDPDTQPLEWWKVHNKEIPLLSELAHRYLCPCATSVPSERIFSTGGNIVTTEEMLSPLVMGV